MKISDKILLLREAKKISRKQLAATLNISLSSNGKIERGETEITVKRLEEIASALDVELDFFFTDKAYQNDKDVIKKYLSSINI
jgi:transcriptional regulator with XRE-family HTH domain